MNKYFNIFLLSVFFFSLGMNAKESQFVQLKTTENKTRVNSLTTAKYIFFNNMDAVADSAYYMNILKMSKYKDKFVSVPFSVATFQNNKITDFDLAIFPIADFQLNISPDGSVENQIITKIKEMITAGKKVIIFGRKSLWWAFNPSTQAADGKDATTIDFLSNSLGIQYAGTIPIFTTQGSTNTYSGFTSKGSPKDPIGLNIIKMCNIKVGNQVPYQEPLRYYTYLDIFKSKDLTKFVDVDHFISGENGPMGDTLLAVRTQIGDSRILFASYGLDNVAEDFQRSGYLERALDWCLESAPQPGAQIEKLQSELQYGNIIVDNSQPLTADFKNSGTKNLIIDSIYIDDSLFGMGGFSIDGNYTFPMTVLPDSTFSFNIRFKPTEKSTYYALLTVVSNSAVSPTETVDLRGTGIAGTGPRIFTNIPQNKITFPKTKPTQKSDKEFKIYNKGTQNLILTNADITPAGIPVFLEGFTKLAVIKPGDSLLLNLKFSPVNENKIYDGKLTISSNATDMAALEIIIHAESDFQGDVYESSTQDGIFSITLLPNPNNGLATLLINSKLQIDDLNISLYDLKGNFIKNLAKASISLGVNNLDLVFDSMNNGNYFISIRTKKGAISLPVIILK